MKDGNGGDAGCTGRIANLLERARKLVEQRHGTRGRDSRLPTGDLPDFSEGFLETPDRQR